MQISLHLHETWDSISQVLKAEHHVVHELVQQELQCQNWNLAPSYMQFNKKETETATWLLSSVPKQRHGDRYHPRVLEISVHVLGVEVLVATSTAWEKLLTIVLIWSFKMSTGTCTMPLLLQTPCNKSKPFIAGLVVTIILFPALSETHFVFLAFRPLYRSRFLYHPLARASCIRGKLSLKSFIYMR